MTNRATQKRLGLLLIVVLCIAAGRQERTLTDRDQYNQGTADLREGDLTSAELLLYAAVAANNESLRPTALYNLGLARFGIGAQTLEAGPEARPARPRLEVVP